MANMNPRKLPMPEQEPGVRNHNIDEVALGYTAEMAMEEAQRCLQCKNPACVAGCPVNIHIPEFIAQVAKGDFAAAYEVISQTNALPAISGRVCPPGEPVRGPVRPGHQGGERGHWPPGAVRGRLVPPERKRHAPKARLQRP